jgi:hypothetical protein
MSVLDDQISALSAKVTALIMLVEALWVDQLAKNSHPGAFAKKFCDDLFEKEKKVRERIGESSYDLQIVEVLTSLMDRAVTRALELKKLPKR